MNRELRRIPSRGPRGDAPAAAFPTTARCRPRGGSAAGHGPAAAMTLAGPATGARRLGRAVTILSVTDVEVCLQRAATMGEITGSSQAESHVSCKRDDTA